MFEINRISLGNKSIYQMKNIREIHELLRHIKSNYSSSLFPEKSYNDALFEQMLKRTTYIVPIYNNSIPVLIYMSYFHNSPCVFVIKLNSPECIYIIPFTFNHEYQNILLYGELLMKPNLFIHFERILSIDNKRFDYYSYDKHIKQLNSLYKLWNIDWFIPKPIYSLNEINKLLNNTNNVDIIGVRFYSFSNPVVFYKNKNDLYRKNFKINDIPLMKDKDYWVSKNKELINNDIHSNSNKFDPNINYKFILNTSNIIYGIYHLFDDKNNDMGILRLSKFEEHNELYEYIKKFKYIHMTVKYNTKFNKWYIPFKTVKDSIIKAI